MFIVAKRNIVIPSEDSAIEYFIAKDYMGIVPEWVGKTKYFQELVEDGKIVASTPKDKDLDAAEEKEVIDNTREKQSRKTEKK